MVGKWKVALLSMAVALTGCSSPKPKEIPVPEIPGAKGQENLDWPRLDMEDRGPPLTPADLEARAKQAVNAMRVARGNVSMAHALLEIQGCGDYAINPILEAMDDPSYRNKRDPAVAIQNVPGENGQRARVQCLDRPVEIIRVFAAMGLPECPGPMPVDKLIKMADRGGKRDRAVALSVLKDLGDPRALSTFLRFGNDPEPTVATEAIAGLRLYKGPAVEKLLASKIDGDYQMEALASLAHVNPKHPAVQKELAAIKERFRDEAKQDKFDDMKVAGYSNTAEGEAILKMALKDADEDIRMYAAGYYALLKTIRDPQPLYDAIRSDNNGYVRTYATQAVGLAKAPGAIQAAASLVTFTDEDTAEYGFLLLTYLADPASMPLIQKGLDDPRREVALAAAYALSRQPGQTSVNEKAAKLVRGVLDSKNPFDRFLALDYLDYGRGPLAKEIHDRLIFDSTTRIRNGAVTAPRRWAEEERLRRLRSF